MDQISTQSFFDKHVKPRWPDWEPEGVEIADWLFWIGTADQGTALQSIREHRAEANWKRPSLAKFRTKVKLNSPQKAKVEMPDPTVFVMYEGGGRGSLNAGYHLPIIVPPDKADRIGLIAENVRGYYANRIGGLWKVYTDTTQSAMGLIRHGFYKQRADRQG